MKAQDYSVFKLLIAVIFSVSLLYIVVSYIQNFFLPISSYDLIELGLENANKLNGMPVEMEIFYQNGDIFIGSDFAKHLHLKRITFRSKIGYIKCSSNKCSVLTNIKIKTIFKCYYGECVVIFGGD